MNDDPLRPARGIATALLISALLWAGAFIALVVTGRWPW